MIMTRYRSCLSHGLNPNVWRLPPWNESVQPSYLFVSHSVDVGRHYFPFFFLEIIHFHSVSHRCAMIFSRVSVWLRTVFPVSSSLLVDDDASDRGLQELSTDCGDYFPLIVDSPRLGAFFCSVSYVIEIRGHKEVRIAFEPSSLCV